MKTYPRVAKLLKEEAEKQGGVQPASLKVGINRTSYSHYCDGSREPTTLSLQRIAAYFRVSVAWLRGDSDELRPAPNGLTPEKRLLWDIVSGQMTDDEALEYVLEYRKRLADRAKR